MAKISKWKKVLAAKFIRFATRFAAGGRYDVVEGETRHHRGRACVEWGGEDEILPAWERDEVINLMRNQMRNSPVARTIDQQRRVNIVGAPGGKLTLTFRDKSKEKAAKEWENWFNHSWATQCEFTNGMTFNEFLAQVVTSLDNSGDIVVLFDAGELCNSGRLRVFESDEIANLEPGEFARRFKSRGFTQSQGQIFDRFGRSCGVVVSSACRGSIQIPADRAFVFLADPAEDRRNNYWTLLRRAWRFNQGRGIAPLASAIGTLTDITDILASDVQSTKLNSHLFGAVLDEDDTDPEEDDGFDPNQFAVGADGKPKKKEDKPRDQEVLDFSRWTAIGARIMAMPRKSRLELFDTKRPNPNMQQFINWLAGMVSGVYGMGRIYSNLNPEQSYTAFRGAQCLSWPSFRESQKLLERNVCDWAFRQASRWALRERIITTPLPDGWERAMSWSWPRMPEVDEVDAETARTSKLRNMTTNYHEIFGPNWRDRLEETFEEMSVFDDHGVPHPARQTVAGAVIEPTDPKAREEKKGEGKNE